MVTTEYIVSLKSSYILAHNTSWCLCFKSRNWIYTQISWIDSYSRIDESLADWGCKVNRLPSVDDLVMLAVSD